MKKNEYKKRIADKILEDKLATFGGVLILGPKGCGKTTTALMKAKTIIELQDEDKREQYIATASITPSKLLIGEKPLLIDEWQDIPKIWGAIRKSIDDEQKKGLYMLTGSSSVNIDKPHSGTMRISEMIMYPMSLYETGESNGSVSLIDLFNHKFNDCKSNLNIDDLIFAICRGGWPQTISIENKSLQLNIAKYLFHQTCYHDISNLNKSKKNPQYTEMILRSYARNIATLANNKVIYDDVKQNYNISERTLYDYINLLKQLFIIEDVPSWSPAIRSKTAIRNGNKRNFIDPSVAVAALGVSPEYFNKDFKTLGFLFESICIRDLKIYSSKFNGRVSYYRDTYGLEADAVLHLEDGRFALLEFKLGANEIDKGASNLLKLEKLIKEYNLKNTQVKLREPDLKIIITATEYGYKRTDGVYVIPIGCLKD